MRRVFLFVLLAMFLPQATGAATIYLRDRTRIEEAKIIEETPLEFHIRKADGNYSFIYSYDTVNKGDIFCVIDDKGAIRYPATLAMVSISPGSEVKELSPQEFQAMMLQQELEGQRAQTSGLKGLGVVALISALAAVSSSIALWCMYSRTN